MNTAALDHLIRTVLLDEWRDQVEYRSLTVVGLRRLRARLDLQSPEFLPGADLESALLGYGVPDYVVMHSRRWNWLCSQVGTSWPFVSHASVPTQQGGVIVTNEYGDGVRGVLSNGLKVIVDNNIPTNLGAGTNEDRILMIASQQGIWWEDPAAPVLIRAEQPLAASLGVLLVVYGYAAYTWDRYGNNPGVIGGTGLVAPSGF